MTYPIDAHHFPIINVADPTNAQDAATKNYVDTHGIAYPIDAHSQVIINVADPLNPQDAATRNYVDTHLPNIADPPAYHAWFDQTTNGDAYVMVKTNAAPYPATPVALYERFRLTASISVSKMKLRKSSLAQNTDHFCRLGIYDNLGGIGGGSQTGGSPGNLVWDFGTVNVKGGAGEMDFETSGAGADLLPGIYWTVLSTEYSPQLVCYAVAQCRPLQSTTVGSMIYGSSLGGQVALPLTANLLNYAGNYDLPSVALWRSA